MPFDKHSEIFLFIHRISCDAQLITVRHISSLRMQTPRTAVVTGGRGLGAAIAAHLCSCGYHVIVGARTRVPTPPLARWLPLDLLDASSVARFAGLLLDELPALDLLVNNAAVCPRSASADASPAVWDDVVTVNFYAVAQLTTALLPLLRRSERFPRVLNISSGDGELAFFSDALQRGFRGAAAGGPGGVLQSVRRMQKEVLELLAVDSAQRVRTHIFGGQSAYRFSKAALNAYTRASAAKAHVAQSAHIAFVAACPGDVDTDMADPNVDTISPARAAELLWCILDVDVECRNGVFLRHGKGISW